MKTIKIVPIALAVFILTIIVIKVYRKHDVPPARPFNNPIVAEDEPEVKPPSISTPNEAVELINKEDIKKSLEFLASDELEGRMSGKKGNIAAAEYIKEEFEKLGLSPELQQFKINRTNPGPKKETGDDFTCNVIGFLPGNDPQYKDEIVVIGAHYDHIGYGPSMSMTPSRREIHNGADDNASGTVALLNIAKAFVPLKSQIKRTIVFQAYSAEEMGLIGSRYYCDHPTFPKGSPDIKKHVFMVNMDMIGRLGSGTYNVAWYDGESSIDVSRIITELNGKYTFAKRITSQGTGGSDHACFYNKRVPVAFLHTGMHKEYHTPDDKAALINFDGLEKVSRYAFELMWKIVQSDTAPRFNHKAFKTMDYTHDHGHPDVEFFIHPYHKHELNKPHEH